MDALIIENVSKEYGTFKALDNINLTIKQGDFVGLLGVNGAGKTTLISAISGVKRFDGRIKVHGYDVVNNPVSARHRLGVVPQELAFDPFLTVYQTLKLQSGLYGVKNNDSWIEEIVEKMFLKDKIDSNTRGLSGGMKRRLMVAQALVHKPPVIILDEPTAGVDVELRKNLWEFISSFHTAGHTILLTTHYLEEVEALCNKIIMIDKGKILAQSSKHDLINNLHNLPTTLELEILENKILPDVLKSMIISRDGSLYKIKLENNDVLVDILNLCKTNGLRLGNINIHKPNLEDIFINYIKR